MNGPITGKYNKDELLAKLRDNRASHHDLYEKAWEGYRKATLAELEEMLDRIKDGKSIPRYLSHTPPEDHTGDYDDVIAMFEMSVDEQVELTQGQFKQYVQDDWGWKEQWLATTSLYTEGQ